MGALDQLFQSIRAAFHPSPLKLAITISVIVIFVGGLIAFYLVEGRRHRLKRQAASESAYAELVERHHLLPSDEDVIARMAQSLKSPDRKHLLLTNHGMFNAYAQRLIRQGEIPEAVISALRVKLGFLGEGPDSFPVSTASLPTGCTVALRYRTAEYRAHVLEPQTQALRLRVDTGDRPAVFFPGSLAEVVYQNRRGTFRMKSSVIRQDGELLSLEHSEEIAHAQHRAHFRKRFGLGVEVRLAKRDERPVQSRFLDLGGGGASLYNPESRYHRGDQLELRFQTGADESLTLLARVIRTSGDNSVLHVAFGELRESARDRIYRVLFQKKVSGGR